MFVLPFFNKRMCMCSICGDIVIIIAGSNVTYTVDEKFELQ